LRKAAEIDLSYRDGLLELASLYEKAKRPADAVPSIVNSPICPRRASAWANCCSKTGQAADAIPQLEQAVSQSPTAANRFALAAAYMRNSQPAKAVPLLEQAVAGEPQNFDLRLTYGRALRDLRQFSNAAREFFFSAKIKPESVRSLERAGRCPDSDRELSAGAGALDRVRALGGEKAAHLYFRAIILDRSKQYKPALEAYRQFLATSQNQSPDEEFKARQRVRIIQKELSKR